MRTGGGVAWQRGRFSLAAGKQQEPTSNTMPRQRRAAQNQAERQNSRDFAAAFGFQDDPVAAEAPVYMEEEPEMPR